MKVALQEVSRLKKRKEKATEIQVWLCDEAFLGSAELSRLNELAYQVREESNSMQLLRALHIYRLHKQAMHILQDVPLSKEITNNIILK